jgi:hypothetical protein
MTMAHLGVIALVREDAIKDILCGAMIEVNGN